MSTPFPITPGKTWQTDATLITPTAAPSTLDAARTQDLSDRARRLLTRAQRWIERGEFGLAERTLAEALVVAPGHPELLRLRAIALHMLHRYSDAITLLRRALETRPDDALIHNNLGSALGEAGDLEGAVEALRRASEIAPELATSWFNLGKAHDVLLQSHESEAAYARAIAIDPTYVPARVMHANVLKTLGRLDEAAGEFRDALLRQPDNAAAWAALIGMKSSPATDDEIARLEALYRRTDLPVSDRCLIGFAYALALEAHGRYREAYETTVAINALRRTELRWDAAGATRIFDAIAAAFAQPLPTADAALGHEVIFVIGMPRSGSTLAEQILAAHPDVQGAGELGDLRTVLMEESQRRGIDFPAWVDAATAADWTRLGKEYLKRTQRWRRDKPRSTDKSLQSWQLVGAIRSMLPGAAIVECRRDPLETLWSTFKHQFGGDLLYSYDIDELTSYWHDYERLMRLWNERFPGVVFHHDYEALLADPETRIRALLDACGLAFDPVCLRFHEVERDVRTASAGQVRVPLQRDTARAAHYGELLDPLRRAMGRTA